MMNAFSIYHLSCSGKAVMVFLIWNVYVDVYDVFVEIRTYHFCLKSI